MKNNKCKVENINGKPNQFIIKTENGTYFQSYETTIVFIDGASGQIYIDKAFKQSKTTAKYTNQFLGFNRAQIENRIANGEIILTELN